MKSYVIGLAAVMMSVQASAGLLFEDEWEKPNCPEKHSFAWCVMRNVYPTKSDFPVEDTVGIDPKSVNVNSPSDLYYVVGMAGSAASLAKPVFSSLGAANVLGTLGWLFNSEGIWVRTSRVFGWLPADQPREVAERAFMHALADGVVAALGATKAYVETDTSGISDREVIRIVGGPCDEKKCFLGLGSILARYYDTGKHFTSLEEPPAFLGQGQRYEFDAPFTLSVCSSAIKVQSCGQLSPEQQAIVSSKLPDGSFIYSGMVKANQMPAVFVKGVPHFFVVPEKSDRIAAGTQ